MRRTLLTFLLALPALFAAQAINPSITFVGVSPADGGELTSGVIELEFDLSAVYAEFGEDAQVGIAKTQTTPIRLYHGTSVYSEGELVQSLYDGEEMLPTHPDFQLGNKFRLAFDESRLIDGEVYTLQLTNSFYAYSLENGANKVKSLQCFINQNFTFTAHTGKTPFAVKKWSVDLMQPVETLRTVEVEFTKPIAINPDVTPYLHVSTTSNNAAKSFDYQAKVSLKADNPNVAVLDFGAVPVYDYNLWTYTITLPDNAFFDRENPARGSYALTRRIVGSKIKYFNAKAVTPGYDRYGAITGFYVTWEDEENPGGEIDYEKPTYAYSNYKAITLESGAANIKCLSKITGEWPKYFYPLEYGIDPDADFTFTLEENMFHPYVEGYICYGIRNCAASYTFKSPGRNAGNSIAPAQCVGVGITELKRLSNFIDNGYSTPSLVSLDFAFENYTIDDAAKWVLLRQDKDYYAEVCEVNGETERVIDRVKLSSNLRGTTLDNRFGVVICKLDRKFYKGKKYRIKLPANCLYLCDYQATSGFNRSMVSSYGYYLSNDVITFDITGTNIAEEPVFTPLVSTNPVDGSTLAEFSVVGFEFKDEYELTENAAITFTYLGAHKGNTIVSPAKILGCYFSFGTTTVTGVFRKGYKPFEFYFENPEDAQITLVAGSLRNVLTGDILNEDFTITMHLDKDYGKHYDLCTVNLAITAEDGSNIQNISHPAVQGESVTVNFNHDGWKVEKLTIDNLNVTSLIKADGSMTFTPSCDTELAVKLAYDGEWLEEHTSGLWQLTGSDLKVYAQGGSIVIEGLTAGDAVSVYNTAGVLLRSAVAQQDTLRLTVGSGTVIVLVNGRAAKLQL